MNHCHLILIIYPLPGSTLLLDEYHCDFFDSNSKFSVNAGNVCVRLVFSELEESYKDPERLDMELLEGVKLVIDGDVPSIMLVAGGGPIAYYVDSGEPISWGEAKFCWPIELRQGEHTAILTVRQSNGEINEYRWTFSLISPPH